MIGAPELLLQLSKTNKVHNQERGELIAAGRVAKPKPAKQKTTKSRKSKTSKEAPAQQTHDQPIQDHSLVQPSQGHSFVQNAYLPAGPVAGVGIQSDQHQQTAAESYLGYQIAATPAFTMSTPPNALDPGVQQIAIIQQNPFALTPSYPYAAASVPGPSMVATDGSLNVLGVAGTTALQPLISTRKRAHVEQDETEEDTGVGAQPSGKAGAKSAHPTKRSRTTKNATKDATSSTDWPPI